MKKLIFKTLLLLTMACIAAMPIWAAETILEQPLFQSGKATLTFESSPLEAMTEIPFAIELTDSSGTQISDVQLSISMDMPAMPMPPNNPEAVWENNAYRGKAVFTMAGAWQVKVAISQPGITKEQIVFDIQQVMMK